MKSILIVLLFLLFNCGKKQTEKKTLNQSAYISKNDMPIKETKQKIDILKILLDEEIGTEKPEKVDYENYSVSFDNDGDSYSVSFRKIASEDLNKDGIEDYIIERNSEGMLGGNVNTNYEILYMIMGKDDHIQDKHRILAYAPFSYNILNNITYKNGVLKATATQNYRTYSKPEEELESADLSFIYKEGNVYEETYLSNCELAKWKNKKVLKNASESFRTIDMHNYTEVLNEKFNAKDFECTVELSGCENLDLIVEGNFITSDLSQQNIDSKRKQFLNFLVQNTSLTEDFKIVQSHYLNNTVSEELITKGKLSFNIFTNKEKGKINFRLVLNKDNNQNQAENWEITTRKK
ncbi:hypothetical protein [Chryseobacterium indoltheticum]|uniref:Uncharacterized protein n=1 Tax=Chryseobacterium indoltheticum TaxID=254 RepID=A0A381FJ42_9FLAO|nr:hypothetical protein [Chryseobacterium indoltheticum]SUX46556.1 Uncharacterised protein [Chryseobacterium indoltheticum]